MKITERIYDAITGETSEIERDLSNEEIAELQKIESELAAKAEKAAEISQAKAALLLKLGITEDEAKLLLS